MEPLMGTAEQISASTRAVIITNTYEMMYEDQMAAGPPESKPRKMKTLL